MNFLTLAQRKLKNGEKKDTKNMYICININARGTELYHTLRRILLRVEIQNEKDTQVSLEKKSEIKSVKDCQSSL